VRSRRRLLAVAIISTLTVSAAGLGAAGAVNFGNHKVGRTPSGAILPENQKVTPAGTQIEVDGRLVSSSLRPDGATAAALTWQNFTGYLSIIDVAGGTVRQQLHLERDKIGDGTVTFDGPLYSADGKTLWFGQSSDVIKLTVADDGTVSSPTVIPFTQTPGGDLPSGMALSEDGAKLYVALNTANEVAVVDASTNAVLKRIPVGNAPRQVVLKGGKAYISDEGGRRAQPGDSTNLSYTTPIVADKQTGAATTGDVSVVDLAAQRQTSLIPVGLHPTALLAVGNDILVANGGDDSVSAIDTTSNTVGQTFNVNPLPSQPIGAAPNGLGLIDATHVAVTLGRDNALAVYTYTGARTPVSFEGLVPTAWYPVGVQFDSALGKLVVTNDKGVSALGPDQPVSEGPHTAPAPQTVSGRNVYADIGSLSVLAAPSADQLKKSTAQVYTNNGWFDLAQNNQPARRNIAPVALPANLGEPSKIKHVFLIVKENRTYDQVLGDVKTGQGNPALAQFGQTITPNQHALGTTFPLLDNFYDSGTLSADGHNWLMQANANDYTEKEFGNFERSYPASGGDALAYQRNGFLWNAAKQAGRTARDWGEYANFFTVNGAPNPDSTWQDWYHDSQVLEGKATGPLHVPVSALNSYSDIASLNNIMQHHFPNFDMNIPDQYRADLFLKDFQHYEEKGNLPNLNMVWLPVDHTAGNAPGFPIPVSEVADNDLAVGRIVDAISHSKDWKDSAVFVVEDDAQDGTDHVDGHRSTALIASPFARRGVEVPTYYTQVNMVRTIEQILGMAPMNQMDLAAEPMRDAFTDTPDTTPYTAVANQIPLDWFPGAPTGAMAQAWSDWSAKTFAGTDVREDQSDPAKLNRAIWYSSTDYAKPYPGDAKVLTPDEVRGVDRPAPASVGAPPGATASPDTDG